MIYKIPFTAVAEKSYLSFLAFGASSAWDLPVCDGRGLMDVMSQSFTDKLAARIKETGSALCVGLDPRPGMDDLEAIPALLRKVVEETAPYAAAFKPNIAYFEAMGLRGLEILEDLLPDMPEDVPVVLDAKRGDIGETQKYYAHAYFERLGVDAVTLSPFMGYDTLEPFLDYEGKGIYLLTVTSNPGSADVERQELAGGRRVFELVGDMVLRSVREGCKTSVGMVVGLTNADSSILERIPDAPLLIPGLGAQGGDLSCLSGSGHVAPPLINVSRGIMYQNPELGFAEKAAGFAQRIREALNY